jgi:hypothetical protein
MATKPVPETLRGMRAPPPRNAWTAPVLILGVERSGTTWLGNIFDSHPATAFFMEPFAPFAEIFPGFPGRLSCPSGDATLLREVLADGVSRLHRYKHRLLDRLDGLRVLRCLSLLLARGHDAVIRSVGGRPGLWSVRSRHLNLNRPTLAGFRKDLPPATAVVKELRLNLQVPLLAEVFPRARYVVALRNPLAQLHSITRLFAQGSLVELKQSLCSVSEFVAATERFEKYRRTLPRIERAGLLGRLVLYWFLSYNTLLEDLAARGSEHRVVAHEDLSARPRAVVERLFADLGLRLAPQTAAYVASSSTASGDPRKRSPLDTQRCSSTYAGEVLRQVRPELRDAVLRLADPFWELSHQQVARYQRWVEASVAWSGA